MGRMYSAVFRNVAVTVVQDLFEINAPATTSVIVHALTITQSSDAGDAESEQLRVIIHRGSTSGSGGTVPTARPLRINDTAFAGTVEANNTTQSTEGVILHAESFNVMAGLNIVWTPETRPVIAPSGRLIVELETTPADSLTMAGTIYFESVS